MMHPYWHKVSQAIKVAVVGVSLPLLLSSAGFAQQNVKQEAIQVDPKIQEPIEILIDYKNQEKYPEAINQLSQTPNVVDLLIKELETNQNPEVIAAVLQALSEIGEPAKISSQQAAHITDLIIDNKFVSNPKQSVRVYAIEVLKEITPPDQIQNILKTLFEALKDDNKPVRYTTAFAINSLLRKVDLSNSKSAIAIENVRSVALDTSNDWQVRMGTAYALGSSGRDVQTAITVFKQLLEKNNPQVTQEVIDSLMLVGDELSKRASKLNLQERLNAKEGLQDALDYFHKNSSGNDKKSISNIDQITESLNNARNTINNIPDQVESKIILDWIVSKPQESVPILIIISWLYFVLMSLWLRPLWLLRCNDILQRYTDIPLPSFLGNLKISDLLRLLLFRSCYHPRVLDAWVKANLGKARKEFDKKTTVKERSIYVPIPVILDGIDIAELTAKELQPKFSEQQECLLIWGEGGSGKTSLACQIARWAMSDDLEKRVCQHRMLPILVEQELDFKVAEGKQVFLELIRGLLKNLVDAQKPVSEEFLEQLLIQQRLLVIVDHFSEMSPATREQIRPELPGFPVNALIVTSRMEESLAGVNKTVLQPMRVERDRLLYFIQAYITQRGKQDIFKDQELVNARDRLLMIAGKRDVTVLLAKLFIEQIIAVKTGSNLDKFPKNIPDLILEYLNRINGNISDDHPENSKIHQDVKIIAWECLKQTYRPTTALKDTVIQALGSDDAEARLKYLENRLCIIQTVPPSYTEIRFVLDPLAEYLAAMSVVEHCGNNEQLWHEFFAQADTESEKPEMIKGFLLAVLDCSLAQEKVIKIPEFALLELNQRTN
ncbi:NACHT domain-containing protein [Planktothrix agardhii 1033]|nr:NACHT domain-containing protein [Planktothrix agardhii 1033]